MTDARAPCSRFRRQVRLWAPFVLLAALIIARALWTIPDEMLVLGFAIAALIGGELRASDAYLRPAHSHRPQGPQSSYTAMHDGHSGHPRDTLPTHGEET
jgi:hypothetical protein